MPNKKVSQTILLLQATVSGAVVLALEILGTRVIGVQYGSGLFVWAALLSVTMICLSIGYLVGGHLADRLPHAGVFCLLLMGGGAAIVPIPYFAAWMTPLSGWLGLAWGALVAAMIVFFHSTDSLGDVESICDPAIVAKCAEWRGH